MPGYVISEVIIGNEVRNIIDKLYDTLLSMSVAFHPYYAFKNLSKIRLNNKTILELIFVEPIKIVFSKFNVEYETKIDIYCYFIQNDENKCTILVSPRGIGLIKKGSLRKYTDFSIWQNIISTIFFKEIGSVKYIPLHFGNDQLKTQLWGEKLVELEISLHGFGKIKMSGKDISDLRGISEYIDSDKLLKTGLVSKLKVRSNFLKKVVEVRNDGVIKVNERNNLKVIEYMDSVLERMP